MHPNSLDFFHAISTGSFEAFLNLIHNESLKDQAPWILNADNIFALDFALAQGRDDIMNTFLKNLARKGDTLAYTVAMVKSAKALCSGFRKLDEYFELFQAPEKRFTFLEASQQSYLALGLSMVGQWTRATEAANEFAILKPNIQHVIRALMVEKLLSDFFNQHRPKNISTATIGLIDIFNNWILHPIFAEHSTPIPGISYIKNTDTVTTFTRLKKACVFLTQKKEYLLDETIPLEMAENILLLCAKCYPFCVGFLQISFGQLACDILSKFDDDPVATRKLFEALTDKQWLRTDNYVPIIEKNILKTIPQEKIRLVLRAYGQNIAATQLRERETLTLTPAPGMDIIGLYPSSTSKKQFELSGPLDETAKNYLHLLLMNNADINLKINSVESIKRQLLSLFPYTNCRVNLVISNKDILPHLSAQLVTYYQTHAQAMITIPRKLLLEEPEVIDLLAIRYIFGSGQTLTVQILDTLQNNIMLTDMTVTPDHFKAGPFIKSKTDDNLTEDIVNELKVFYEFYDKLPWQRCFDARSVFEQIERVDKARQQRKPLLFVFNYNDYDKLLLTSIQSNLRNTQDICMIRFDKLPEKPTQEQAMNTQCDFILSARTIQPGPLCDLMACSQPRMYTAATEHLVRAMPASPKTDIDLSLELTDKEKIALGHTI